MHYKYYITYYHLLYKLASLGYLLEEKAKNIEWRNVVQHVSFGIGK